jgi:DNA-binding CsgD family transcriptional regulator
MEDKQFREIMDKLDKLTRVVALSTTQGLTSTEKIQMLHRAGFAPSEIADIIGTTPNVVNVRLSEMRRRRSER